MGALRWVLGWAGWLKSRLAGLRARDCDFCGEQRAEWIYPDPDAGPLSPAGAWWACAACHPLVERKDHQALADRAAAQLGWHDSSPAERQAAARDALDRHERFFRSRPAPRGYRAV